MASEKKVLILGGYGRTGLQVARLLLHESRHRIGIAGRDPLKATRTAMGLNWEHAGERVTGVEINVGYRKKLKALLKNYDLVIVSIPHTAFGEQIVQTAYEAGIDYIDISGNGEMRKPTLKLDKLVREAGLTFITQAGFVPGVETVMERYLAGHFDSVDKMTIGGPFIPGVSRFLDVLVKLWEALGLSGLRWGADLGARLRARHSRKFMEPFRTTSVKATASGAFAGVSGELSLTLKHQDPCLATAVTALPCILGLLDGSIKNPGVHVMGHVLDPDCYLGNLWDMGMKVSLQGLSDLKQEKMQPETIDLMEQVA